MDRNNFERLRTEIQLLLTEYEEMGERVIDLIGRMEQDKFLYKNIVRIINDTEDWEED